jgi:transcriptional regulator with XRE-family HTH domain
MTLEELSEKSGVATHTISGIERGVRKPRMVTLAKLAEGLDMDVAELMGKALAPA